MRTSPAARGMIAGMMRKAAPATACLLLLWGCGNQGDGLTEEQKTLLTGDTLRGAEFRGADLRGVDLRG